MDKLNELQRAIIKALEQLIKLDLLLIETQPQEECINHRLAQHLEHILYEFGALDGLHVDVEYDKYKVDEKKMSDGTSIRPDIIVHERQSGNRNNLIAIEAKKEYHTARDRAKIKDLVISSAYNYGVGSLVSYFPKRTHIIIKFYEPSQDAWVIYQLNKDSLEAKWLKNEPYNKTLQRIA